MMFVFNKAGELLPFVSGSLKETGLQLTMFAKYHEVLYIHQMWCPDAWKKVDTSSGSYEGQAISEADVPAAVKKGFFAARYD